MIHRSRAASCVFIIAALAVQFARRADGSPIPPHWLLILAQAPLIIWHIVRQIGRRPVVERFGQLFTHDARVRFLLTSVVIVCGVALSLIKGAPLALFTATTTFIVAGLLFDALTRTFDVIGNLIDQPRTLWSFLWPRWLGLMLLAAFLLSLPIATQSGVPDYAHNFLQHVLNSIFTAVSAACLIGTTIYDLHSDYTLFGQAIILILMHLCGIAFAMIGLAAVRPYCSFRPRPATVLKIAFAIELLAILIMTPAWQDRDAPTLAAKCWWSIVHAGSALWNGGLVFRVDGLLRYFNSGPILSSVLVLATFGSISFPILIDLLRKAPKTYETNPIASSRMSLAMGEILAVLILLITGATLLFWFESAQFQNTAVAESAPAKDQAHQDWLASLDLVPPRPFDLGENQVPIHELSTEMRWRCAVFLSSTLRSAGLQSIPVSEGALSWPTFALVLVLILIGGSAGGVAGGIRTTTLTLLAICGFQRQIPARCESNATLVRRTLLMRLSLFIVTWLGFCVTSVLAIAISTEGTWYEKLFDTLAAANGVGLSTGLTLHLTPTGRIIMILIMIGGRCLAALFWLSLAQRLALLSMPPQPKKK